MLFVKNKVSKLFKDKIKCEIYIDSLQSSITDKHFHIPYNKNHQYKLLQGSNYIVNKGELEYINVL